jgi:hypothetical protein
MFTTENTALTAQERARLRDELEAKQARFGYLSRAACVVSDLLAADSRHENPVIIDIMRVEAGLWPRCPMFCAAIRSAEVAGLPVRWAEDGRTFAVQPHAENVWSFDAVQAHYAPRVAGLVRAMEAEGYAAEVGPMRIVYAGPFATDYSQEITFSPIAAQVAA